MPMPNYVHAELFWLDLEGLKGISDAVERDRQDIALEDIHETAGDSTCYSEGSATTKKRQIA